MRATFELKWFREKRANRKRPGSRLGAPQAPQQRRRGHESQDPDVEGWERRPHQDGAENAGSNGSHRVAQVSYAREMTDLTLADIGAPAGLRAWQKRLDDDVVAGRSREFAGRAVDPATMTATS